MAPVNDAGSSGTGALDGAPLGSKGGSGPPAEAAHRPGWKPALALFGAALVFYWLTLAPTVLWGDDAFFQRAAWQSRSSPVNIDHALWLATARLFTYLPWGDVAFRVNLLSAVAGAGSVALVYLAGRQLRLGQWAAAAGAVSLAVSHTFWSHAVRAEVYTLFTLFLAGQLLLWFAWRPGRSWPIALALALFGLSLLSHQMAVLLLPALALRLWQGRHWVAGRQVAGLLLLFVIGLLPFLLALRPGAAGEGWPAALLAHYTRGGQFSAALFDFSPATLGRDVVLWLGFLGLQFFGLAAWLGLAGLRAWWREALGAGPERRFWPAGLRGLLGSPWGVIFVLYLSGVAFAFSYHVNDQFVFYLPSYVAFALFAGRGWQAWEQGQLPALLRRYLAAPDGRSLRPSRLVCVLLIGLLLLLPPLLYNALPRAMNVAGLNPLDVRTLPGRDPNWFFLWPGKRGYQGAADFGRAALAGLPEGAHVIADHTPLQVLAYLQVVEGMRPDVTLLAIEPGQDLAPLVAELPAGAALFLADDNPAYYNAPSLGEVALRPAGVVYAVEPP